jgi:hypothetical protein
MSAGEREGGERRRTKKGRVWCGSEKTDLTYHTLRKDMRMGTRRMVLPHDSVRAIANRWTNVKKIAECTKNATRHPEKEVDVSRGSNRRRKVVVVGVGGRVITEDDAEEAAGEGVSRGGDGVDDALLPVCDALASVHEVLQDVHRVGD